MLRTWKNIKPFILNIFLNLNTSYRQSQDRHLLCKFCILECVEVSVYTTPVDVTLIQILAILG
jgi:hypothetical protein